MHNILKSVFVKNWENEFIIDASSDRRISYKDFFSFALNGKEALEEMNLKRGDRVCLLMDNSLDLVVVYFAALLLQLVVIPVDPNKSKKEKAHILTLCNCKIILCDGVLDDVMVDSVCLEKIRKKIYTKRFVGIDCLDAWDAVDYNPLYLVTFTSGSTGLPKGVMHSFGNLISSAVSFNEKFNFNRENVFYHNLPMTYMAGILNLIILPFIAQSKIVIGSRFDISKSMNFWDVPIKYSVNTFWFIPTIVSLLLKLDRGIKGVEYFNGINAIGCVGTAPLSSHLKRDFEKKYNIKLYESYGLSETLFVSTNSPFCSNTSKSVGLLLTQAAVSFWDDKEIIIKVPWMFLGYLGPEKHCCVAADTFKSGDIGEIDNDGFLFIKDRKKDLIIRGGMNISPRRIEEFINKEACFEENTVLGMPDDVLGEKTVCFFAAGVALDNHVKKKLNSNLLEEFGKDFCIDEFIKVDYIPKNINGKIDRVKLREIYKSYVS